MNYKNKKKQDFKIASKNNKILLQKITLKSYIYIFYSLLIIKASGRLVIINE